MLRHSKNSESKILNIAPVVKRRQLLYLQPWPSMLYTGGSDWTHTGRRHVLSIGKNKDEMPVVDTTTIEQSFITINKTVLWAILIDGGIVDLSLEQAFNCDVDPLDTVFTLSKFLKGDRNHARIRSMTTDSVSLCIHIERDIQIPIDRTVENDATCTGTLQTKWVSNDFLNRRVIAIDPGQVTPFCGMEISPQGQTIVHNFSRGH
eukprot:768323-Hanusia_phi.AAC.2